MIERSFGSIVLDGGENWNRIISENDNYVSFNTNSIPNKAGWGASICDKFIRLSSSQVGNNISEGFYNWGGTELEIGIAKSKLSTININGFKQWLSKNPTTIVYKLAEPTYEEVPTSQRLTCYENATLFIDTNITPTHVEIEYPTEKQQLFRIK